MPRRDQITLTPAEQLALLEEERIVIATTNGPRGWPHSMPLWYTVRDGDIWAWTFAKSQKVRNLERDPRCTLLVEAGVEYGELRGVQIEAEAELVRDLEHGLRVRGRADDPLRRGDRLDRGRRGGRPAGAGAETGGDPLPPGRTGNLGSPQARWDLLTPVPR